ncbi:MAG TPA: PAS domain S-box protein [Caulobacter sp.]|nr:PAS domain S-box protein [Caulobacter sp.]
MASKRAGPSAGRRNRPSRSAAARWFFDNSLDMFAVVNREGIFVEVNDAWQRNTGWTREDLVGKTIFEFLHEDCFEEAIDSRRRMKRDGYTVNQLKIRCKDGRWIWIQGRSRLDPDDHMVGTLHDITEAVAQKEELEAARRTRSMLSEAAGIGTWSFEPLSRTIVWSPDIHAMSGWSPEEIADPEDFYSRLDPAEIEGVRDIFTAGVESGRGGSIEHRLRARDGRWLTMRATFRTERRGPLFALQGISQDVTALAQARDAARAGESRVKALMEQARMDAWRQELALSAAEGGVFEIDHVHRAFWASEQFFRLVGQRMDYEAINVPVWPFVHPDERDHVESVNHRWSAGEENETMEFRIVHPDGEERWVRVFYRLDQTTRKGVGLVLDIDARKRQELALVEAQRAAQAGAEAKARFLANMSHEIRTPMNGVLGVLHLLRNESMSVEGHRLLDEALGCGEMLSTLLDDVIDFERIEAGRLEMTIRPVDAGDLAASVARLLEPQATGKGLTLTIEGEADLGWVATDPVRLRQCLFNLVGNAVKFTLEGGVRIVCEQTAPGRIAFVVHDTGVGIPQDAQALLFERFHQADASTTRRFGGSGLGLSIARKLARLMGGDVTFASTPGAGSVFRLEIAALPAAPANASGADDALMLEDLRVLVVEDNATNRTIAVKLLAAMGAEAVTAEDGLAGVEAARFGGYDLILMDIQMPGIDGMEAARRIRALGGAVGATPIIALTANVLSHQRELYLAGGMDGVVGKPISPAALVSEIARLAQGGDVSRTHVA